MTMPTITPASFPTPDLAVRSTDAAEIHRVRRFAAEQADAAEAARLHMVGDLRHTRSTAERVEVLKRVHEDLIHWRHTLAIRINRRLGSGLPYDASRFRLSMRDGGRNFDRIGYVGRLRENPRWDPTTRTFQGGRETPAFRIMLHYRRVAEQRFATEPNDGETLVNVVALPNGSHATGNSLVRGHAARKITGELVERIERRGLDTNSVEAGGEPMYVVAADDESRKRVFQAAMTELANADHGDVRAWQAARYLLYQGPQTKKGNDAVTRTFLVAVGAMLFDEAPVLEQDVDLRCLVAGQRAATSMPHDPVSQRVLR